MDKIPCPLCRKHRELIYFKRLREHLDRHAESPEIIALPNVYICGCCAANIGYSLGWILVGFIMVWEQKTASPCGWGTSRRKKLNKHMQNGKLLQTY